MVYQTVFVLVFLLATRNETCLETKLHHHILLGIDGRGYRTFVSFTDAAGCNEYAVVELLFPNKCSPKASRKTMIYAPVRGVNDPQCELSFQPAAADGVAVGGA